MKRLDTEFATIFAAKKDMSLSWDTDTHIETLLRLVRAAPAQGGPPRGETSVTER